MFGIFAILMLALGAPHLVSLLFETGPSLGVALTPFARVISLLFAVALCLHLIRRYNFSLELYSAEVQDDLAAAHFYDQAACIIIVLSGAFLVAFAKTVAALFNVPEMSHVPAAGLGLILLGAASSDLLVHLLHWQGEKWEARLHSHPC